MNEAAARLLAGTGCNAFLVRDTVNIRWFTGFDGVPSAPASLNADTRTAMCAVLTWPDVANATGYLVWTNGVECAFVATNAATCARSSRAPTTFGVSAVNGNAQSARISRELPPAPPPPFILFFR